MYICMYVYIYMIRDIYNYVETYALQWLMVLEWVSLEEY